MIKKKKKVKKKEILCTWDGYAFIIDEYLKGLKPLTKKQLAENKKRELKEKKRRAKKITMTVGELEDRIDESKYDY